ncbi:MAG: hypothetical protein R3F59_21540 [Myxococcota bacterium]
MDAQQDAGEEDLGGARTRLQGLPGDRAAAGQRVPNKGLRFNVLREFLYHLTRAALLAIVPGTIAIGATLTMFVVTALPPINKARGELIASEQAYHQALHNSQPILAQLEAEGAPSDQIQVVYFAFDDAEGDEARRMADTYLGVLVDQSIEARSRSGSTDNTLTVMLGPANSARRSASEAYREWNRLLDAPSGRLAVLLGLVHRPTLGMSVYERSHPRR